MKKRLSIISKTITITHNITLITSLTFIEQVEENKKLYVALLKEKDEKIALLETMLNKK